MRHPAGPAQGHAPDEPAARMGGGAGDGAWPPRASRSRLHPVPSSTRRTARSATRRTPAGLAGQFPPLRNRVDKIAATAEGRHYLADVLIHGMAGSIDVDGDAYVGYMPAFARLPDDQIAGILNWVSSLGDSKPVPLVAVTDLAASRTRTLTAAGVLAERTALAAQHPLP